MTKNATFLALALLALCWSPCSAQISFESGAKVGLNFANIEGENTPGTGGRRRTAPAGGVTFMVDPGGSLAFQTELLYMSKGDQWIFGLGESSSRTDYTLDYLELPLLLKLQASLLGSSEASLYAGPAPALKINGEVTGAGTTPETENLAKRVDLGGAIGVEFGFGVGEGRLVLDIRITPGFVGIKRGDDELLPSGSSNQVFSIMGGFAF